MEIRIRNKIFPRKLSNLVAFWFLFLVIPIIFWFEIFIVLPTIHEPWSFGYLFHTIMGTFLLVNITSNLLAAVLVDPSIRGRMLEVPNPPDRWHLCAVCESFVPPRSWHCEDCGTCVLKRDHHCLFTACCIGHHNHRYFLVFLTHLFIATSYATYFNGSFVWRSWESFSWYSLLKLIFPMAVFLFDSSINQFYLTLYAINIAGIAFAGALLGYHLMMMYKGQVTYESANNVRIYDYGWKQNLKEILGERWYLTWIFPTLESKLPHNGIVWHTREQWMAEAQKHR
ncbi:probable palmitoyltransferase ZDHHC24 [Cloeon dipterum]|uniref:probable palmitoyltransferase ZDHHC24 n=1 Tax=Cloeon dipterum TaxID=197152 RepID=UPI00322087B7